jgi:NADPH-dependent ferric siderophore reductase
MTTAPTARRVRREPPRFRQVVVTRVEPRTLRLVRMTLTGDALVGMPAPDPAASVRLLLPIAAGAPLVIPEWNGNEFLLPDGTRPILRTFTPWRRDPESDTLTIDIALHGPGAASAWATTAVPGAQVAVSGPGRGSAPEPDAPAYLLLGDESAVPAIEQVLAVLPSEAEVRVVVELADERGRLPSLAGVDWQLHAGDARPGETLVAAARDAQITAETRVWAAGEAAAMQRIRRHLFEERGLPRPRAVIRGYWKTGSAGDSDAPSE